MPLIVSIIISGPKHDVVKKQPQERMINTDTSYFQGLFFLLVCNLHSSGNSFDHGK